MRGLMSRGVGRWARGGVRAPVRRRRLPSRTAFSGPRARPMRPQGRPNAAHRWWRATAVGTAALATLACGGAVCADSAQAYALSPLDGFNRWSQEDEHGDAYLAPEDLIVAIVPPYLQERAKAVKLLPSKLLREAADPDGNGKVDPGEFIFFLTLLSIPEHVLSTVFRLFDEDGNGLLEQVELSRVMHTVQGQWATPHQGTVLPVLFGNRGGVSLPQFSSFMRDLKRETWLAEFRLLADTDEAVVAKEPQPISGAAFAQSILSFTGVHSGAAEERAAKLADKVCDKVTFDAFVDFYRVVEQLDTIGETIDMFMVAGEPFTKEHFHRAAHAVTGIKLDHSVVNVLFALFDEDGDQLLDAKEFQHILISRSHRGLVPVGGASGVSRMFQCAKYCWQRELVERDGL